MVNKVLKSSRAYPLENLGLIAFLCFGHNGTTGILHFDTVSLVNSCENGRMNCRKIPLKRFGIAVLVGEQLFQIFTFSRFNLSQIFRRILFFHRYLITISRIITNVTMHRARNAAMKQMLLRIRYARQTSSAISAIYAQNAQNGALWYIHALPAVSVLNEWSTQYILHLLLYCKLMVSYMYSFFISQGLSFDFFTDSYSAMEGSICSPGMRINSSNRKKMTKGARSEIARCEHTDQTILRDLPSQSKWQNRRENATQRQQ